jgi:hypothetical protein
LQGVFAVVGVVIVVALAALYWKNRHSKRYLVLQNETDLHGVGGSTKAMFDMTDWEEDIVFERRKTARK